MRAVLFIDYQNTYMLARRYFADLNSAQNSFGQFNPTLLANKILDKNSKIKEIEKIRIYRGIPSVSFDSRGYKASWNQINYWKLDQRVEAVTRPLSYRKSRTTDGVKMIVSEKGIDVSLAVDFVTKAISGDYDLGIIFSSDTDLKPALEFVNSTSVSALGHVAAWRPARGIYPRLSTTNNQPFCYYLNENDYLDVADYTKY